MVSRIPEGQLQILPIHDMYLKVNEIDRYVFDSGFGYYGFSPYWNPLLSFLSGIPLCADLFDLLSDEDFKMYQTVFECPDEFSREDATKFLVDLFHTTCDSVEYL